MLGLIGGLGWVGSGAGDGKHEAEGDGGDGVAGDGDLGGDFWSGTLIMGLKVEDGGAGAAVGGAVAGTLAFELEGALILFSGGGVGDGAVKVSLEDEFVLDHVDRFCKGEGELGACSITAAEESTKGLIGCDRGIAGGVDALKTDAWRDLPVEPCAARGVAEGQNRVALSEAR